MLEAKVFHLAVSENWISCQKWPLNGDNDDHSSVFAVSPTFAAKPTLDGWRSISCLEIPF